MEKELEFNGKIYISSKRGGEITGYTHDYIGQLCRSGKIKGQLVGRTRFVDKESLLAHMEKNTGEEERVTPAIFFASNGAPVTPPVFSSRASIEDTSARKIPIIKKEKTFSQTPIAKEREAIVGSKRGIPTPYISKTPALFKPELIRRVVLFAVIFSLVSGGYGYLEYGIPKSVLTISFSQNKTLVKEDHRGLVAPYTATFSPGFIPGASLQGAVGTSLSEHTLSSFVRVFVKNGIDRLAVGTYRALESSFTFGKERVLGALWKKETLVFNDTPMSLEPSITQSGLVAIPSSGNAASEKEEREKIKEHFSDEVIVIPDETGGAGVIQPVFKSDKDEQYSFVLVPVKR